MELNYFIREVKLNIKKINSFSKYPYCLSVIKNLSTIKFHPKVTYIVGENGTGKSTILEAIAIAYGFNPEGGSKNFNFSTRNTHSDLWKTLKLIKGSKIPKDGFFLRSESFYNLASNIDDIDVTNSYGGSSLHLQSHGESFMSLIMNRFRGNGLYILDEPEAALSPTRQMVLISRIHDLIEENSQFIISTHSPIMKSFVNNPKKMLDILGVMKR